MWEVEAFCAGLGIPYSLYIQCRLDSKHTPHQQSYYGIDKNGEYFKLHLYMY